jgi:PTH1 family peptidyl-tRNA hydrolase
MKVVVGLGNPGARYRKTRHNLGFMVVDRLAERWGMPLGGRRFQAELGVGTVAETRTVLAKPLTFMNASGDAVARLRRAYRLEPAAIIAVHDDLDLELGRVRVRGGGGPGGHRGVASLIAALGAGFLRVRIGIGRPSGGRDPVEFVLEPFTPAERPLMEAAIERAADAVESLLRDGLARTMNAFNRAAAAAGP